MFIYCLDEVFKNKLINNGFKLLRQDNDVAIFILDKQKFDSMEFDKSKVYLSSKLNF